MDIIKGMLAGLVATIVLSALMIMKSAMGLMPGLEVIDMLGSMMGTTKPMAWLMHFVIGTVVWGGAFAALVPFLPGNSLWLKGVIFGLGAWLVMMVVVMPMAGKGLFGMSLGAMAPVMTAMLHMIFGAVLGGTYGALLGQNNVKVAPRY